MDPWEPSPPISTLKVQAIQDQILSLLQKQVIEKVRQVHSPGYYSRFFVVPKKTKGVWRSILDLSTLGRYVVKEKFKMETVESIRTCLRQGQWVTSLDFTDAYFHVSIHPLDRKFLRFAVNGCVYQFRVLPMGLTSSPRIFTRVVKCVKQWVQKFGIHMYQYLDDWLIAAPSRVLVAHHTQFVLRLAQALGLMVNMDKSELEPTQNIQYLGYLFVLSEGLVRPPAERWLKIQQALAPFLDRPALPAQDWQHALGLLASTEKMVPLGLLHMRPIQIVLSSQWNLFWDSPSDLVEVTEDVRQAVRSWLTEEHVLVRTPLNIASNKDSQLQVFTDASQKGWGGHLEGEEIQGDWNPQEQTLHINVLELMAVQNTFIAFEEQLRGKAVLISTDNTTVVAYIRKQGGTRSVPLFQLAKELWEWVSERHITLQCRHIAGRLNVIADRLSRAEEVLLTEWGINNRVLQRVWLV
jgi:hypothetical protein